MSEDAERRWLAIKRELDDAPSYLVEGRAGVPKVHPLVAAERAARDAFMRTVKILSQTLPEE